MIVEPEFARVRALKCIVDKVEMNDSIDCGDVCVCVYVSVHVYV